jgi:hypothetical protein
MSERSDKHDGAEAGKRAGVADATNARTTADFDKAYAESYKAAQRMIGKEKGWTAGLADACGEPKDEDL